jgi:hypothetical protein
MLPALIAVAAFAIGTTEFVVPRRRSQKGWRFRKRRAQPSVQSVLPFDGQRRQRLTQPAFCRMVGGPVVDTVFLEPHPSLSGENHDFTLHNKHP